MQETRIYYFQQILKLWIDKVLQASVSSWLTFTAWSICTLHAPGDTETQINLKVGHHQSRLRRVATPWILVLSHQLTYTFCSPRHKHFKFVSSLSLEGVIGKILIYFCMRAPPSTKLTVRSVVICSTLTEDKVTFSGEWHAHCTSWFGVSRICEV